MTRRLIDYFECLIDNFIQHGVRMLHITIGSLIAFLTSVFVVYIDGYQAIRKRLFEVPQLFFRSLPFAALATACGLIAAAAYCFTTMSTDSEDWLATILGSRIENSYLRAFYTGLAILTIIRSKLLQVRGADIGLEYVYGEFRVKCLGSVLGHWVDYRDTFIRDNLDGMFAINGIANDLKSLIEARVEFADPDYKASVNSQITAIFKEKPTGAPDPSSADWRIFYRALINMTLENCGPDALKRRGFH